MRSLPVPKIFLLLLLVLGCGFGCKPKASMPTPLPVEQLPGALEAAFSSAAAETKDLASQVVASVRARDYSKAHPQLQILAATPHLTQEQLTVTARAMLTLNDLLQAAQNQGDQKAAQTLQNYNANK